MKAAIYARYSSDNQREASIEDQSRNCERACSQHGFQITHRFSDEAMSGAKVNRPGYQAILEAARRREFDIIVVDEVSRLWRDQEEQWRAVKLLEFRGIHILGVSDGIDTRAGGYRLLLSIRGAMNEEARREVAWRTHRGIEGQVRKGFNGGGRLYGYRNVPVYHETEKDNFGRPVVVAVGREIDPEQAQWVLWIFERYAGGWAPRKIADGLNKLGIPSPGSTWARKVARRCNGWAASSIYGDQKKGFGILFNPLYVGRYVWNRTKRVINPETKGRQHQVRAESEWVVQPLPELRIVPEDLWTKVQARRRREAKEAEARGKHPGGPVPRYLLSGVLKCGVCGGNYVMTNGRYYACGTHKDRGAAICSNSKRIRRDLAEQKLLAGVKEELLSPEAIQLLRREIVKALADERRAKNDDSLRKKLAQVEQEIANVIQAVKAGAYSQALRGELARLEAEKERLDDALECSGEAAQVVDLLPEVVEEYRKAIGQIEEFARQGNDIETARELLRHALRVDKIPVIPTSDGHLEAELPPLHRVVLLSAVGSNSGTEERT